MLDSISALFENGQSKVLEAEETLFYMGNSVQFMYLVREGQVDLVRHSQNGARMILHRATAGQVLAEASAYSAHYHCDGEAVGGARVSAISVAEFRKRLDQDSALSNAWALSLAHALQGARMSAEIRTLRTVAERLDAWLDGGRALPAKGQRKDLAQVLGVSQEALYREIAKRR